MGIYRKSLVEMGIIIVCLRLVEIGAISDICLGWSRVKYHIYIYALQWYWYWLIVAP